MAVSIDGAGSVTGLDAVDVPVYADAAARDAAIASPTAGQIVFVTGTGSLVYNGTAWVALGAGAANFTNAATGDYVSGSISYKYITFTGSGELVVDQAGFADVLVLGGGAGGGAGNNYNSTTSGGGGAGAPIIATSVYLSVGTGTVVIGAGGAGGVQNQPGRNGNPSALYTVADLYALGGGGGGAGSAGVFGGSGGGGGGSGSAGGSALISTLGKNGGTGQTQSGGGGGGFGSVGSNSTSNNGGNGGTGGSTTIAGTTPAGSYVAGSYAFAGGGGGAGASSGGSASDGGSAGSTGYTTSAVDAAANKGGGGGGSGDATELRGKGGSGIIIVRVVV